MAAVVCEIVDCYTFRRAQGGIEFLLLKRAPREYLGGTWHAVHGRIEPGETAWQAAVRELREETGLRPLRLWQIEHVNTFYQANRDCVMMCPCFAAEVDPTARVTLSAEHVDRRWVPADQIVAALLWPGQQAAAREILTVILAGAPAEPRLRIALEPQTGG